MQPRVRVIFMGSPAFAVPSLLALLADERRYEVVGVVAQPDKPAGRGQRLTPAEVKVAAAARGVQVLTPVKMKAEETRAALAALSPDLVVVAAYGRILPPSLLALPRFGCINVHASLLPRHRGASPIAHAILEGDRESGVALMRMDEGLDTGPVYVQRALPIAAADTAGTLSVKLAELGATLLCDALPDILRGALAPTPQTGIATYAPLLDKQDGRLDFSLSAAALERRVRAMQPWPGAFACRGQVRVQVLSAAVEPGRAGEPGTVLEAGKRGLVVACGEDSLLILELKPAGKAAMPASAFVAGRQVVLGDRFDPVI